MLVVLVENLWGMLSTVQSAIRAKPITTRCKILETLDGPLQAIQVTLDGRPRAIPVTRTLLRALWVTPEGHWEEILVLLLGPLRRVPWMLPTHDGRRWVTRVSRDDHQQWKMAISARNPPLDGP
mmetsp:Transcript_88661/g.237070  ORF Transcript_88661/g.237070 Transcript_88661/m.237070 type:complete len:124 (-) Transcript_88661:190-561(-)